ncbi:MAG: RNA degradosome polyphosphate kinase, partial [bacterium]|nr:RNA degradosome polyphosphate kinase [bacterium]
MIRPRQQRKQALLRALASECKAQGIEIATYDSLGEAERAALREQYLENVFPLVTPQAMTPAHPFPFLSNLSLNLLVTLSLPSDERPRLARVEVPVGLGAPRFMRLGERTFVPLEQVMASNLDLLFPGMKIENCAVFRVTRNANTGVDEDLADDPVSRMESGLRARGFAPVV